MDYETARYYAGQAEEIKMWFSENNLGKGYSDKEPAKMVIETIIALKANNEKLRAALEAMIGGSGVYLTANSSWWSMHTAGQSMPTALVEPTFEFEMIMADCLRQVALGIEEIP